EMCTFSYNRAFTVFVVCVIPRSRPVSRCGRLSSIATTSALALSKLAAVHLNSHSIAHVERDRQPQMAHTIRGKRAVRLRAFAEGTAVANRRENLKWKTPPVCAAQIHS